MYHRYFLWSWGGWLLLVAAALFIQGGFGPDNYWAGVFWGMSFMQALARQQAEKRGWPTEADPNDKSKS